MREYCVYCIHAEKQDDIYCRKKDKHIPIGTATTRNQKPCEYYEEGRNVITGKKYAPRRDLTGQRFGRLTVIERYGRIGHQRTWLCKCDCGKEKVIRGPVLMRGDALSCGCYARERSSLTHRTHGMSDSNLYRRWRTIIDRCNGTDKNHERNYKERGIVVCSEWRNSFEAFRDWALANGYKKELTIDRIDFNGNYEPSNCRWIPERDQHYNTRKTCRFEYNGKLMNLRELESISGIPMETIRDRVRRGWTVERAATEEIHKKSRRKAN